MEELRYTNLSLVAPDAPLSKTSTHKEEEIQDKWVRHVKRDHGSKQEEGEVHLRLIQEGSWRSLLEDSSRAKEKMAEK